MGLGGGVRVRLNIYEMPSVACYDVVFKLPLRGLYVGRCVFTLNEITLNFKNATP